MGDLILGPGGVWFDPSPLGEHRIVEFLPLRRIWKDPWKSRHLSRKATFPGCDVDQVLPQGPSATHLPQKVIGGFDREAQLGQHGMKPSAAIAQQVEEWFALHGATVSKKACSVQRATYNRVATSRFWLGTGD